VDGEPQPDQDDEPRRGRRRGGATARPGAYSVRLQHDGRSFTEVLTLYPDPGSVQDAGTATSATGSTR
jgi:hypothetical protein